MKIFLDESGYSGTRLLDTAPVFVLGSCCVSDVEAADIYKQVFEQELGQVELKHVDLRRTHQNLIVKFVKIVNEKYRTKFRFYVAHKKYLLVVHLVNAWLESHFFENDEDFYDKGQHKIFANLLFACLMTLESDQFWKKHLGAFERMMNSRSEDDFHSFWSNLESDLLVCSADTGKFLRVIAQAGKSLGVPHLKDLPENVLDICFPALVATIASWRDTTDEMLIVMHDKASELEKMKWMWDIISSPSVPERQIPAPVGEWKFPLNVEKTQFVDSKLHRQVQYCDLLAGAAAEVFRWKLDADCDAVYAEKLQSAGVLGLLCGGIWPSLSDAEDTLKNYPGGDQEAIEFLTAVGSKGAEKIGKSLRKFDTAIEAESTSKHIRAGDSKKAFLSAKKLADHGYPYFQVLVGEMFATGYGINENVKQAIAYYERAARQKFASGALKLGHLYLKGKGVAVDFNTGASWMKEAAEYGDPDGQYNYGVCLMRGQGTEKNEQAAVDWWEKAAGQGQPDALRDLAACYFRGEHRPLDRARSFELYEEAALRGDIQALFYTGQMYQQGQGTPKDMAAAYYYWRVAAERGHPTAEYNVAVQLLRGVGISQDVSEAMRWLKSSAEHRHEPAMKLLAQMQEHRRKGGGSY